MPFARILCTVSCLLVTGCSFSPAEPWAMLEPEADIIFDPPASREAGDGYLKTAQNFEVRLNEVGVTFEELTFTLGEAEELAFDLATPPPGYSLCHNGHCHHDDGRLVDYEEISRELVGAAAAPELVLSANQEVRLDVGERQTLNIDCEDCGLDKGAVGAVSMTLSNVYMDVDIRDTLDEPRCEARSLTVAVPLREKIAGRVDEQVGPYDSALLRVELLARLPEQLIDIEWCDEALAGDDNTLTGELAEILAAKFRENALLETTIVR